MSSADVTDLVIGALTSLGASTIFVLALFLSFCILMRFLKLRATRGSMIVRSLDERVGQDAFARYLSPNAPRGPANQLKTLELLEKKKAS